MDEEHRKLLRNLHRLILSDTVTVGEAAKNCGTDRQTLIAEISKVDSKFEDTLIALENYKDENRN